MRFDKLGSLTMTTDADGLGPVARMRMHAAAHIEFSEMEGNPAWYRAGTAFAGLPGQIPPIITVADDLRMLVNITENMEFSRFIERILDARIRLLGRSGLLAIYHAPTLEEGLDAIVKRMNLTHPYLYFEKVSDPQFITYKLRPLVSVGNAWPVLSTVSALMLQQCVSVAAHDRVGSLRVAVPAPAAAAIDRYQEWFHCDVGLGGPELGVAIPLELAKQRNNLAEEPLWAIACQRLDVMAQELDASRERTRVRAFVRENLLARAHVPTLKEAALHLHHSERTLIRRLAGVGTSYRELVDEERRARAQWLIMNRSLSIPTVADMLGFPDRSIFGRKFRSWTGQTPAAYRARHMRGAPAG